MELWSRRAAVGSLLAGITLAGTPLSALDARRLPPGPMRLTRRLTRQLGDGRQIVVERSWRVVFAQKAEGATVSGHQIGVSVDAPEKIAAIAEIERNRPTDGMFPILLGVDGLIVTAGEMERPQDLAAAVARAQEMIAHAAMPAAEKQQAGYYLAQIGHAGGDMLERMPRDLFFPRGNAVRDTRAVDLPDGSRGEFELVYTSAADQAGGWLIRAERRITTRIAASERSASERWTMRAA